MPKEVSAHRLTGKNVWSITTDELNTPAYKEREFTHITWREDGLCWSDWADGKGKYLRRG